MDKAKRITVKDIAKMLNISIGTVDRAIHDRGRINPETRQMVLDKMKEIGYTPNSLARALGKGRPTKIKFISPSNNVFWQNMIRGAQDAAEMLVDYNISVSFDSVQSEDDVMDEASVLEKAIAEKPDGLLLVPLNDYLMQMQIEEAAKTGIAVATVNRDVPASGRLFYYGENPYNVGQVIGTIHAKLLHPGDTAACMKLRSGNPNFELRLKGWRDAIAQGAPGADVRGAIEYTEDKEDSSIAYEISKRLLSQDKNLKAIFANTAIGAAAAAAAVRDTGRLGQIIVVGLDVSDRILDLLESRAMFATIEQSPYTQGFEAVKLMHRVLMENYVPEKDHFYTKLEVYLNRAQYEANLLN